MPLLVRTRLTAIDPPALALTVRSQARVRVRGQVCGYVRCGRERRWAWGAFDETFQLTRGPGAVRVRVVGLGGVASQTVRFLSAVDLRLARPLALRGKLHWTRPRVPAISPLSTETIRALGRAEGT